MIVIEGPRGSIESLAFHPDGTRLALASGRGAWTQFFDATTGAGLTQWAASPCGLTGSMRFHPSGQWLFAAAGGIGLTVVDTASGKVATHHESRPIIAFAIDPTGDRVVVAYLRDRLASFPAASVLDLLRTHSLAPPPQWTIDLGKPHEYIWYPQSVAFFPDGKQFVSAVYQDGAHGPVSWVHIRSATDGSLLDRIGCACGVPRQVVVSPDGKWVALRSGAALLLFSMTDAAASVKLQSPNRKHLTGLAFHPSGRYLAVTSNDKTVRLHDRDAGWAVTRTFEWDIGKLKSVAFNADGTLAAAGGDTGKVVVWDVDV
jgi:WD40 repeat protein